MTNIFWDRFNEVTSAQPAPVVEFMKANGFDFTHARGGCHAYSQEIDGGIAYIASEYFDFPASLDEVVCIGISNGNGDEVVSAEAPLKDLIAAWPQLKALAVRLISEGKVFEYEVKDIAKVGALAEAFVKVIDNWLTDEEMAKLRELTSAETDPHICHTHDFCDANMAMDAAFREVMGRESLDLDKDPSMSDETWILWNTAWDVAKASLFTPKPELPRFKTQFGDYPVEAFPAIPEGFEDVSWGNDVCPSIVSDKLEMLIWIDYPDVAQREFSEGKRFTAERQAEGVEIGSDILIETDDWAEVLKLIDARRGEG